MTTTTAPATARDALANRIENLFYIQESGVARMDWGDMADAMITALRDAGYDIVRRGTDAADVEARARETIERAVLGCDAWGGVDMESVGPAVAWELGRCGLRIVDAAQDDRRNEALAAFEEFVAVIDGGASMGIDHGPSAGFARRKLAPYLHDGDTGGEG